VDLRAVPYHDQSEVETTQLPREELIPQQEPPGEQRPAEDPPRQEWTTDDLLPWQL
jgi:hypothetical protein